MEMNRNLTDQIQRVQAMRASANVEGTSPTEEAIVNNLNARGQQQIGIRVGNYEAQAQMDQDAAAFYNSSATSAIISAALTSSG
jgi:hypothetical protein